MVIAGALAAGALAAGIVMAWYVTERVPHLEDEITYLFQARIFARGALWAPPPASEAGFYIPFTLIYDGKWIGKYPIGWPLVLALGERFGLGWLVNPVLGALTVAVIYRLGTDLYDRHTGLTAALLAVTSPLFLIQSGTVMGHALTSLCTAVLLWSWLRIDSAAAAGKPGRPWAILGGAALGLALLARPLTALGAAIPFGMALAVQFIRQRGSRLVLLRAYAPLAITAGLIGLLQLVYLTLVTGSPLTNLYTLIWPYDRLGFGPGIGPYGGHTLRQAVITTHQEIELWASDLFGWPYASWLPLIPGIITSLRGIRAEHRTRVILLAGPFVSLVVVHMAYWVGARVYGPRYFYEAHAGLSILAAVGLHRTIRWIVRPGFLRARPADSVRAANRAAYAVLAALILINGVFYLPKRLADWHGLYGITREPVEAVEAARQGRQALIFVHGVRWVDYAALMALNSPWLDGPVVVAHDLNPELTASLTALYPDREVWFYHGGSLSQAPLPYTD
jgi:4-amino-4-deoxy-L-arabinose transferase-like glycosyltransferase